MRGPIFLPPSSYKLIEEDLCRRCGASKAACDENKRVMAEIDAHLETFTTDFTGESIIVHDQVMEDDGEY